MSFPHYLSQALIPLIQINRAEKIKRESALNRNAQTVKDEGMDKGNRGVNDKGDLILARWRLQEERELNLCNTKKKQRKRGETTHRENTDTRSLTHTNSHTLSLPTQLSERPVFAFSHLAYIGGIHV